MASVILAPPLALRLAGVFALLYGKKKYSTKRKRPIGSPCWNGNVAVGFGASTAFAKGMVGIIENAADATFRNSGGPKLH